jgi:aminopeptidase N
MVALTPVTPMLTLIRALVLLVVAVDPDVRSEQLSLFVETSADLSSYTTEAEFTFDIRSRNADVLFFVPGSESPLDLGTVEVDGSPISRSLIHRGVHPKFGNSGFLLRAQDARLAPGRHTLRVRGAPIAAPARGLTLWGRWHPILGGGDQRVPVELEVRAPAQYAVVSSGLRRSESVDGSLRTSKWHSAHPQGWGGVFLAVGRYRAVALDSATPSFEIVWPEDLDAFDPGLAAGEPRGILQYFAQVYGIDRAAQFRMVAFRDSTVRNFAMDGLIGLSTASYERARVSREYLRAFLAHELAHYWWGDIVSPAGPGRRWMTEGFAEYSRYLYESSVNADPLPWSMRNLIVLSRFPGDERPQAMLTEPADSIPDELNYQKGAAILHMLAGEIGRDAVLDAMRSMVAESASGVTVENFRQAAERASGRDLGWFFAQWLGRSTGPELAITQVEAHASASGYTVRGSLTQRAPAYRLTVPVAVHLEDGTAVRHLLAVTDTLTPFAFETGARPQRVVVDADNDIFKWYAQHARPITFVDAWNAFGQAPPVLVAGSDVSAEDKVLPKATLLALSS